MKKRLESPNSEAALSKVLSAHICSSMAIFNSHKKQ